jgi:hypothetical protein
MPTPANSNPALSHPKLRAIQPGTCPLATPPNAAASDIFFPNLTHHFTEDIFSFNISAKAAN